ncbi:uncharacterized protein TrAtP1_010400 [Trichoderma atroviride]|nr:hypothetical protein TrAtP1_010400 [Trichoderma atroviride]
MSLAYVSDYTPRENVRIVNRALDTQIRVGGRWVSIRDKGTAGNLRTKDGYAIIMAIKDVISNQGLDELQQGLLFGKLGWRFECCECQAVKPVSKYVTANAFDIKASDDLQAEAAFLEDNTKCDINGGKMSSGM